jgi:hypothetical protein
MKWLGPLHGLDEAHAQNGMTGFMHRPGRLHARARACTCTNSFHCPRWLVRLPVRGTAVSGTGFGTDKVQQIKHHASAWGKQAPEWFS